MGKTTGNGNGDFGDGEPDETDEGLWAYAIRTVKPLLRDDSLPGAKQPSPKSPRGKTRKEAASHGNVNEFSNVLNRPAATPVPAGLDRRTEARLRRGQMEIEAVLDLHGLSVAQARPRLERFLTAGQAQGLRCVLIITGKGRSPQRMDDDGFGSPLPQPGILRRSLPQWLAEPPLAHIVLRHFPARGRHGGAGAFYVLLRRLR
jgi:DNA-nicking Smr family endonuclease